MWSRLVHKRPSVAAAVVALTLCQCQRDAQPSGSAASAPSGSTAPEPVEKPLLTQVHRLTFAGSRAGESYFGPRDQRIVFQSERPMAGAPDNPFYQIYTMDLATGDTQRVSTGIGKSTCAWLHPTLPRVLYASTHEDPAAERKQAEEIAFRNLGKTRRYSWDYDPHYDIYSAPLPGTSSNEPPKNLTRAHGYDAEGSYSPDGNWILFASNRHAYADQLTPEEKERLAVDPSYFIDLYLMRSDGSEVKRLTHSPGYDGGPFFSPSGERLVWRRFSPDGTAAEIWTMKVDGTDAKQITRLGAMSWAPFYHPSGEYIIFTTNRHGFDNFELYMVDAMGEREPVRVTRDDGFDGLPAFSHRGDTLAWAKAAPGERRAQVYLARWDHQEARRRLKLPAGGAIASAESEGVRWPAPPPPAQVKEALGWVQHLASPELEGRLAGTAGEEKAARWLAERFQQEGLAPLKGGLVQTFTFRAGVSLGANNQLSVQEQSFTVDKDWRPLGFSRSGQVAPAPVVFAGYGIVAPQAEEQPAYDAYNQLDVTGKWVMVLRYLPEDVEEARRQHLRRYAMLRHKATVARDAGAAGLIVVSGPRSKVKDPLVPLTSDASQAGSGLPVISVTDEVAQRWLQRSGKDLDTLQKSLDTGEPIGGFVLEGVQVGAQIDLVEEQRTGHNVLAQLVPASPQAAKRPALLVGAHLDGLGHGTSGGSLAREEEKGQLHPGADDNASGVAAMLLMARQLSEGVKRQEIQLARPVIFAGWGGEELGLLGSHAFVNGDRARGSGQARKLQPPLVAVLNLDMVGRLREHLVLQGTGSSTAWAALIERAVARQALPVQVQQDAYLPTDATTFYLARVPVLNAFTGAHSEYHSPRDTVDKLNGEGLVRVASLMSELAQIIATRSDALPYVEMTAPTQQGRGFRVYLGTIPDYAAADVEGVRLSGVQGGSPAQEAGLQAGDVIIEVGKKPIRNIYDYSYALETLEVGEQVGVRVRRGKNEVALQITPGSRE